MAYSPLIAHLKMEPPFLNATKTVAQLVVVMPLESVFYFNSGAEQQSCFARGMGLICSLVLHVTMNVY